MIDDPYAGLVEMYDLEHDEFEDDIEMYAELLEAVNGTVLEVGSGTGRILAGLSRFGIETAGVERSKPMHEAAFRRCANLLPAPALLFGNYLNDMLPADFSAVLMALDTFAHFVSLEDQVRALDRAADVLRPGGMLILDLSAPDLATWTREHNLVIADWTKQIGNETIQKFFTRSIEPSSQRETVRFWYDRWTAGGPVSRVWTEMELRFFQQSELLLLLRGAGFGAMEWYGDYDQSPFDDMSQRMIVTATKPAPPKSGKKAR